MKFLKNRQTIGATLLIVTLIVIGATLKSFAFTAVDLKEAAFSYRPGLDGTYTVETAERSAANNGVLTPQMALEVYTKLYATMAASDSDLSEWSQANGPAPAIFKIRVQVKNYGNEASRPTPVDITVFAKVGEYFVDQTAFLVDQSHLQSSAHWRKLTTVHSVIPPLAPNEPYQFYSPPVAFGQYLLNLHHEFPVMLKAVIVLNHAKTPVVRQIPVFANHFALDDLEK